MGRGRVSKGAIYAHALALACVLPAHARAADLPLRGMERGADTSCSGGELCFPLMGVVVDGVTAVELGELANAYEPWLAREVGLNDLSRIATAITESYRARGYFLTRAFVPAQEGRDGLGRIVVVEGRIGALVLDGDAADQVAPFLEGVDRQPIANLRDLDARLARARSLPGVSITSRIEPDLEDERSHKLLVTATLRRVEGNAVLDNRGSDDAGPWQFFARAAWNSAVFERDQVGVSIYTTPFDVREYSLAGADYTLVLEDGARLSAAASSARAQDGPDILSADAGGEQSTFAVRYEYPLVLQRRSGLWAQAGFDARHARNDWLSGGEYIDETRVLRIGLRGFLQEDGRALSFSALLSRGFDGLGASGGAGGRRSRYDADARFARLNVRVDHDWAFGGSYGLYASLDAQMSDGPLLASEEFAVGGLPYGRAYSYGEIMGDDGVAGLLQLRAALDPPAPAIDQLQVYAFVDAGQVWNENSLPGDQSRSLSSAGVGLRISMLDHFTVQLESARPLTRTPFGEGDRDWRQFFSVSANY